MTNNLKEFNVRRNGEWVLVSNEPFDADLEIIDMTRGRSSLNFHLQDPSTGCEYRCGEAGFRSMLAKGIHGNSCNAKWQAFKRGSAILLDIVGDAE